MLHTRLSHDLPIAIELTYCGVKMICVTGTMAIVLTV